MEASYSLLGRTMENSDVEDVQDLGKLTAVEKAHHEVRRRPRTLCFIALFSITINAILISVTCSRAGLFTTQGVVFSSNRLYSPAQLVLRRVDRVFASSFGGGRTAYQGVPDETNNKLWQDLYNDVGISRISADEAKLMENRTLPIANDPGYYITSLSVFHQLHCLNIVRQALYGRVDWDNEDELFAIDHIEHCIDSLRQYFQCNADITPVTWIWSEQRQTALEEARVIHTCVDFDAIHQWGQEHEMRVPFDFSAKVADDPLGWGAGV